MSLKEESRTLMLLMIDAYSLLTTEQKVIYKPLLDSYTRLAVLVGDVAQNTPYTENANHVKGVIKAYDSIETFMRTKCKETFCSSLSFSPAVVSEINQLKSGDLSALQPVNPIPKQENKPQTNLPANTGASDKKPEEVCIPVNSKPPVTTQTIGNFTPEKWGIRFTHEKTHWYMTLLPAVASRMTGRLDTPNALPGLAFHCVPNYAKHKIVGFQPTYQAMGIDTVKVTIVGAFLGNEGLTLPQAETTKDPIISLANEQIDSYRSFQSFYKFAMGREVSIEINANRTQTVQLEGNETSNENLSFTKMRSPTGNPRFRGIIRQLNTFYTWQDRTWYVMEVEVSEHGLFGSKSLKINSKSKPITYDNGASDPKSPNYDNKNDNAVYNNPDTVGVRSYGDKKNLYLIVNKNVTFTPKSDGGYTFRGSDNQIVLDTNSYPGYTNYVILIPPQDETEGLKRKGKVKFKRYIGGGNKEVDYIIDYTDNPVTLPSSESTPQTANLPK